MYVLVIYFFLFLRMSRTRPWVKFTRNFWTHLDLALSEPLGKFACNPPLSMSAQIFWYEILLTIVWVVPAIIGLFVCLFNELFLAVRFYSSIDGENLLNIEACAPGGSKTPFKFTLLTNNTCLMPEFLSRKNNQVRSPKQKITGGGYKTQKWLFIIP